MNYSIGDTLPGFRIARIDPEAMKAWAVFLRDPNPIHLDREAVRAQGLGELRINQGPANTAYIINMLMKAFPGGRITRLDCKFIDNVYEAESVEASGTVTAISSDGVACDVWLSVDGRGKALAGQAMVTPV